MQEFITSLGFTIWEFAIVVVGGILAILIVVAFSKNIPDIAHNYIIGMCFKWKKNYCPRDIMEINKEKWYIDHMNSLDIKFLTVIEWDPHGGEIILGTREMVKTYHEFQKSARIKLGNFN